MFSADAGGPFSRQAVLKDASARRRILAIVLHEKVRSEALAIRHDANGSTVLLCCFASADTVTQQRTSQMTGEVVEYRASYSRPQTVVGVGRRNISHSEQVRPLLYPGQIRTLPNDQQLIFVTGFKPFRTQKLRYYEHAAPAQRIIAPPDSLDTLPQLKSAAAGNNDWRDQRPKGSPLPLPPDLRIGGGEDEIPAMAPQRTSIDNPPEDQGRRIGGFY